MRGVGARLPIEENEQLLCAARNDFRAFWEMVLGMLDAMGHCQCGGTGDEYGVPSGMPRSVVASPNSQGG